jgi:hypothetical protein
VSQERRHIGRSGFCFRDVDHVPGHALIVHPETRRSRPNVSCRTLRLGPEARCCVLRNLRPKGTLQRSHHEVCIVPAMPVNEQPVSMMTGLEMPTSFWRIEGED